jgi:hypothetical protein
MMNTTQYVEPSVINTMETPLELGALYVIIPKGSLPQYSGNIMIIGRYYTLRRERTPVQGSDSVPLPSTKRDTLWFDYVLAYREVQKYGEPQTKRLVQERQETTYVQKNDVDIYTANDFERSLGVNFDDYRRTNVSEDFLQNIRGWLASKGKLDDSMVPTRDNSPW